MAVPILQAQGNLAANTTGNLAITLPSYQADDIVVLTTVGWVPNTTTGTATQSLGSPWTKYSPNITTITGGLIDAEYAFFWARATSASSLGTSVSITRPTGWDTGNDTCWAGRAYVIRGCVTTGNPYDDLVASAITSVANPTIPAVTVSGDNRLPVAFLVKADNTTTPTGVTGSSPVYSPEAEVSTTTGTDAAFRVYTIAGGVSTSLGSFTTTGGTAPAQGGQVFFVASFIPLPAVEREATGSGQGTETATGVVSTPIKRNATGAGQGTETATGTKKTVRTVTGSGTGTETATWTNRTQTVTITYTPSSTLQIGNWLNSAGNTTNLHTYVDETYTSPDGLFVRGAAGTTDAATTGFLVFGYGAVRQSYPANVTVLTPRSGRFRLQTRAVNRVDDTVSLNLAVVSLASSTSNFHFGASNNTRTNVEITNSTIADTGWVNFQYANPSSRLGNGTLTTQIQQSVAVVSTADNAYVEIDAIQLELTFTKVTQVTADGSGFSNSVDAWWGSGYTNQTVQSYSGSNQAVGQSFTGNGEKLSSASFRLYKTGSPTGNIYAYLYAHSGTFGSTSVGTGSPLATSGPIDISTLTTSSARIEFTFSGSNMVTLTNGTKYVIAVGYAGGNASNYLNVLSVTSNVHPGNRAILSSTGTWNSSDTDLYFVVEYPSATGEIGAAPITRTATGSGTGAETATGVLKEIRTATGSGQGTQTAAGRRIVARSGTGAGTGSETAAWLRTKVRAATGSGAGTETATGLVRAAVQRTATGSGQGNETATGFVRTPVLRTATGFGLGTDTTTRIVVSLRTSTGSGVGNSTATGLRTVTETATGSGSGTDTTVHVVIRLRTATGSGQGTEAATQLVIDIRTATGSGQGSSANVTYFKRVRSGTGTGGAVTGNEAIGLVTRARTATGSGAGTDSAIQVTSRLRLATGDGAGTSVSTENFFSIFVKTAESSGLGYSATTQFVFVKRFADSSGTGTSFAIRVISVLRSASGSGSSVSLALAIKIISRIATGSGSGNYLVPLWTKSHIFYPPTTDFYRGGTRLGEGVDNRLGTYYKGARAVNVYKLKNGTYTTVDPRDSDSVSKVYLGSHLNFLTDQEVSDLTAAGYGDYIT